MAGLHENTGADGESRETDVCPKHKRTALERYTLKGCFSFTVVY
jgi:hypothetical protein